MTLKTMGTAKKEKILPLASFLIVLIVLFYKRPDAFMHSQFWAEEGIVFFSDAYHYGFKTLFNTCAGYFHLYPRLVFYLAISLGTPFEYIPYVCCYAWLFVMLTLLFYIWNRIEFEASSKFFIAISTVLIPLQAEVLMNLTNVQWIMALFPLIIFSSTDLKKNTKWFWLDVMVLLMTGFTGPNSVILLPLLLFFAYRKRKKVFTNQRLLVFYSLAIILAAAGIISLSIHGSINRSEGEFNIANPAFIEYLHLQYAFLFLGKLAFDMPWILKCLFVLMLFVFAITIFKKIIVGKITSDFTIATFFTGFLFLMATLISYRNNPAILHPHYGGVRNFYLPAICCVWFLISILKPSNNPIPVLSLLMLLFVFENIRCIGRERLIDYHWETYAKKIKTSDTLSIPINPEGWYLSIDNTIKKSQKNR